ncbi:MAG: squalene--hopene cyclase, partial [Actinobacteria bacterium]|nr:squalene--hopene cyclase [Actinomycetota bacterium]MCG2818202.1 squalene--hopene cyclase [Actinomycetes bacterium]MBU4219599.1 squalene--hopene cyclase [Actinomycetota bacterium]MBU4358440.1 squalene--hopene cyclase [Actinomycetota bacterium]MBU4392457.1 squalene--hopene cyclase [Actinomycetota bacterium]
DDGRLRRAAEWMLPRQIRRYGDWAVKNRAGRPGGWCFEFDNDFFPDTDDTAAVLLALDGVRMEERESEKKAAVEKGRQWILSMQCRGGGWGTFDVDNNLQLMNKIPFADYGAMLDPDTVDLSGKILEMLGNSGYNKDSDPVRRCIDFIRREQEPDGCWFGRWGVNYIYGTYTVLGGLRKVGEDMGAPYIRRAVKWLEEHQNPDGGWGESPDSYVDESLRGRGVSTPSQTAWALLGLMSAGETDSDTVKRGIQYLLDSQEENGEWMEEEHTATGYPGHYYLHFPIYRNCFPLMALGRYRRFIGNG